MPTALDRLQGEWLMTQRDGKPVAQPTIEDNMEIVKDHILIGSGHGRIQIDESTSPKRMAIEIPKDGSEVVRCIFRLDGDKLTMAGYERSGKLIPVDFEPDAGNGISLLVYERVKGPRPPRASKPNSKGITEERLIPVGTAPRDLQKEVDQLREQIKRLEKELKERPPINPLGNPLGVLGDPLRPNS